MGGPRFLYSQARDNGIAGGSCNLCATHLPSDRGARATVSLSKAKFCGQGIGTRSSFPDERQTAAVQAEEGNGECV